MTPVAFPQATVSYGPPEGFEESQVRRVPAYLGAAIGGSCDGQTITVVAWKPSSDEIQQLVEGGEIYLTMFGGLAPHMLTTTFQEATHPA